MAPLHSSTTVLCLAAAVGALHVPVKTTTNGSALAVPGTAPANAGVPLDSFVSYSIEFSSFPDFAGNETVPNTFSNNLLNNLGALQGTKPHIRVGGNTQDFAIFNASLTESATVGIVVPSISEDYPYILTFGPVYFEAYHTWPDTKFVHGFNLGSNSSSDREALFDSVSYACEALRDNLLHWELGNEPDLFSRPGGPQPRPPGWDNQDYVDQWVHYTRRIREEMRQACPDMATDEKYTYYAPSFAGTGNLNLDPVTVWADGLDEDNIIAIDSSHNYINGAEEPGVTLQHTLMNHTANIASVATHLNETRYLRALDDDLWPNPPYIMGETNSLYNQGRPGLSNTFGAALWGVDFNLWCATNNISRVHMHQGTNYRYQAWQPIETNLTAKGTKAPYYGSIAVAAFLGDTGASDTQIANLPFPAGTPYSAAYAAYSHGELARMIVINLQEYNATAGNNLTNDYPRPVERYTFTLPAQFAGREMGVQRLTANGSDAITGVTFDGWSYNYELEEGRPVRLGNVTVRETVTVGSDGAVGVDVERSSAVILSFAEGEGGYGNGSSGYGNESGSATPSGPVQQTENGALATAVPIAMGAVGMVIMGLL